LFNKDFDKIFFLYKKMAIELFDELNPIINDLLNIDGNFLNYGEIIKKIIEDGSKKREQIENFKKIIIKIVNTEEGEKKLKNILLKIFIMLLN